MEKSEIRMPKFLITVYTVVSHFLLSFMNLLTVAFVQTSVVAYSSYE
jgi:hypothetical protein